MALFGSSAAAWIWLIARVWLGWEWFVSGWGKVFGGNLTWRFWNWGEGAYDACEWIRDSGHTFFGPMVAIGEITIGIMLILGLFTGIFSFVFAGSAGVNPTPDPSARPDPLVTARAGRPPGGRPS